MATVDKSLKASHAFLPVVVISVIFFSFFYKFISPRFSKKIYSGYKKFDIATKVEWDTRINSSVHAILVSLACIYNFIFDKGLSEDCVWWDSWYVRAACAFYVGYVIVDTVLVSIYYKYVGDLFMMFHHCASVLAFYYVTTFGALQFFANYRLISESSTPFINLRWFLVASNLKESNTYVVNGLVMTGVFFLCRIAIIPHFWWKVYITFNDEDAARLHNLLWICIAVCLLLDCINIFWFNKLMQGVIKALKKLHKNEKNPDGSVVLKID